MPSLRFAHEVIKKIAEAERKKALKGKLPPRKKTVGSIKCKGVKQLKTEAL